MSTDPVEISKDGETMVSPISCVRTNCAAQNVGKAKNNRVENINDCFMDRKQEWFSCKYKALVAKKQKKNHFFIKTSHV